MYCSQSWDAIIAGDTSDQPSRYTQGHHSTRYVSLNKPLFRVMVCWSRYFTVFCFACFKPTKTLNNPIENSISRDKRAALYSKKSTIDRYKKIVSLDTSRFQILNSTLHRIFIFLLFVYTQIEKKEKERERGGGGGDTYYFLIL